MIGSGIGGIAGGFISEAIGGRFETGAMIGSIVGGILGGQVYKGVQAISASRAAAAAKIATTSGGSDSAKEVGNYLLRDASGKVKYTGVGSRARMDVRLAQRSKVVSGLTAEFRAAPNRTMALAREAIYINEFGGAQSMNKITLLLNAINSPGLRILNKWF